MNVNDKYTMVFHKEHNGVTYYSISDSTKQQDGTYANKSYSARFPKEIQPPMDRSKINYKGFTSNKKAENGKVYTTIQVMDWEYSEGSDQVQRGTQEIPESLKTPKPDDPFFASSNIDIDSDDLPFD